MLLIRPTLPLEDFNSKTCIKCSKAPASHQKPPPCEDDVSGSDVTSSVVGGAIIQSEILGNNTALRNLRCAKRRSLHGKRWLAHL